MDQSLFSRHSIRAILYIGLASFGLWSAQRYHKSSQAEADAIGGMAVIRWGGLVLASPLLLILLFGYAVFLFSPADRVLQASDLTDKHYKWLAEKDFLYTNEKVEFFYADGLISFDEGGALLTDHYVATWWTKNGAFEDYWFKLGELCKVEQLSSGSSLEDAYYKLYGNGPENWATLNLSITDNQHTNFIRRLKTINERLQHPVFREACERGEPVDRDILGLANGIQPGLVSGADVTSDQIEWLKSMKFLEADETIETFYSHGDYHIKEGGTLLSDLYFGGWYRKDGRLESVWIKHGQICEIGLRSAADENNAYPTYRTTYGEDEWYQFYLPDSANKSEAHLARIKEITAAAATEEYKTACSKNPYTIKGD